MDGIFRKITENPSHMARVEHPIDWIKYPYPFIYNQIDPKLFPLAAWRECSRQALSAGGLRRWTADAGISENSDLIDQIRSKILPRKGIHAPNSHILITSGAQNALFILGILFKRAGLTVAVEEPGYPEARNAFQLAGLNMRTAPLDTEGVSISDIPDEANVLYTTPSHQFPTTVTMPADRRLQILEAAAEKDMLVIEDDYEAEMNYVKDPSPSLKALDTTGRVIYVGSLSKPISPSLRLGFVVASKQIIDETRAIHQTISRQSSFVTQATAALFIKLGFFDAHLRRLHKRYRSRWQEMKDALDAFLPAQNLSKTPGGTCFWLKCPPGVGSAFLSERLKERGVLIDPAAPFFADATQGHHFFRLGFASVPLKNIRRGVQIIADEIALIEKDRL